MGIVRTFWLATSTAGTLDIISAFVISGVAGRSPGAVLQSVAAGPFGDATRSWGVAGMAAGLVVHYAIMGVMVTTFILASRQLPAMLDHPVLAGIGYGLLLYLFMYWVVLPLRWPTVFPQLGWWNVGNAVFSHVVCVGVPIALIVARSLSRGGHGVGAG